ncbi:hypothetical protein PHLGIDRAFT_127407 [Phlebiopsis gigantea 11061_1 CR5-6]|uniref:B30.2/SPRY domain-containing protein n=1 Tax=Phlebiopsis gigantea (strain 11061_1 CR5-6) TaxID=745531 RepID=A0A0C3RZJ5_PHLG1|nr:hypothetical protein PHLGIDRAFT_127407 [Phlebiopsis gigantea 11061_1 CR5-6]
MSSLPGWSAGSWAYHSEDGKVFASTGLGRAFGPASGARDRVGCILSRGNIYFTRNGELIGEAFYGIDTSLPLYPVVGICGRTTRLRMFFDPASFHTAPNTIFDQVRAHQEATLSNSLRLPTGWNALSSGLQGMGHGSEQCCPPEGLVMDFGDRPVPQGIPIYYFEVLVEGMAVPVHRHVGVGYSTPSGPSESKSSVLVNLLVLDSMGTVLSQTIDGGIRVALKGLLPFVDGDVIGCGLNVQRGSVWWTRNGDFLEIRDNVLTDTRREVCPTVYAPPGVLDITARINFGQAPFRYDIEGHVERELHPPAAAAVVPAEIIQCILEHLLVLTSRLWPVTPPVTRVKTKKRALGACRLTCRHWDRVVKSYMFKDLLLSTEKDIAMFHDVLASDARVAEYVGSLYLIDNQKMPWAHRAMLSGDIRSLTNLRILTHYGPSSVAPASHFAARPPALSQPAAYGLAFGGFRDIATLNLTAIDFPRHAHFVAVLARLPRLRQLLACQLAWPAAQTRHHLPPSAVPALLNASFWRTTEDVCALSLVLASRLAFAEDARLVDAVVETFRCLLSVVVGAFPSYTAGMDVACTPVLHGKKEDTLSVRTFGVWMHPKGEHPFTSLNSPTNTLIPSFDCLVEAPPHSALTLHFQLGVGRHTPEQDLEMLRRYPWKDIDGVLCDVPSFRYLDSGQVTMEYSWLGLYDELRQGLQRLDADERL